LTPGVTVPQQQNGSNNTGMIWRSFRLSIQKAFGPQFAVNLKWGGHDEAGKVYEGFMMRFLPPVVWLPEGLDEKAQPRPYHVLDTAALRKWHKEEYLVPYRDDGFCNAYGVKYKGSRPQCFFFSPLFGSDHWKLIRPVSSVDNTCPKAKIGNSLSAFDEAAIHYFCACDSDVSAGVNQKQHFEPIGPPEVVMASVEDALV
jgi:hypothetical protein